MVKYDSGVQKPRKAGEMAGIKSEYALIRDLGHFLL